MAVDSFARVLSVKAVSQGGGGTPSAYLKSAEQIDNTLNLTNKDSTITTYTPSTFTTTHSGFVPASSTNTDKFLRGDGTWQSVSASSSLFPITASSVTSSSFAVDKTLAEVQTAIEAGLLPVLYITTVDSFKYSLPLSQYKSTYISLNFDCTADGNNKTFQLNSTDGTSYEGTILDKQLSVVSVSDTGTSVETVQYITVNGTEKKLPSYTASLGIDITDNEISALVDAETVKFDGDGKLMAIEMSGADGTHAGTSGIVKAPTATDNTKFLRGDGNWAAVTVTGGAEYVEFDVATFAEVLAYFNAGKQLVAYQGGADWGERFEFPLCAVEYNATTQAISGFRFTATFANGSDDSGYTGYLYILELNSTGWTFLYQSEVPYLDFGNGIGYDSEKSGTIITKKLKAKVDGSTVDFTTDGKLKAKEMTGATSSAAGTSGIVKAPVVGDQDKFLRGDGEWASADPSLYLKGATVLNRVLTLTKQDDNTVTFEDTGVQTITTGTSNGTINVDSSEVAVKGLDTAAFKSWTGSVTSGSDSLITSGAVYTAIAPFSSALVFKGTLGTAGTLTDLPTASADNLGWTYKVIEDGTYASQAAVAGDMFTGTRTAESPAAYAWTKIPTASATDTWRNLTVNDTAWKSSDITTGAANFKAGNGMSLTASGNDLTIASRTTFTLTGTTLDITVS